MVKKLIIWLAVAAIIGPASWALGDTINWPFTTAGNYTVSDATKVDVADGVAKLIVVDQTDDDNTSTGFGWGTHNQTQWDNGNSWLELQAGQASGNFISRVMDAGALAVWNSISWTPERPLYKELPDNKGIETAYPTGNADMTGNVLLMHMNEASGTIVDYSGEGNNGTQNGGVTYGASGKLNTALNFDGTNDYVNCGAGLASKTYPLTFEAWVKPNILAQAGIILNFDVTDPNSDIAFGIYNTTNKILIGKSTYQVGLNGISTYLTAGQWSHWVVVFTDTTHITFYLDGTQKTLVNVADYYTVAGSVTSIGSRTNGRYFNGTIDEVAIYNRALTAVEIADHYKRGVLRLRYQVRSGSTNPPTGNFIGPDGTTGTYYSELSNSTTGLPSLNLTNVDNNQFFQYMAYFETDNSSYSPELKSVVIGPTHYPGDNPTVRNNTGQSYGTLTSFIETLGAGNVGSVKYQISNDGTNWYYWNGFNWVAGSGYSQSNTVAEVNTNCGQFDDDVGTGDFYFKAFLHSDAAAQQVELDQVDLGYTYTITASAGANGSISPSGAVTVNYGADQGFTITPIAHYHVADVLVDSVSVGAVTSYTFLSVTTNHTIAASFAIDTYTITASAGANGSISPSGAVTVNYGADQGFTITPIAHYHIADVLVDSVSVGAVTSYTFHTVIAAHTIVANFAINTHTLTYYAAGAHGSITGTSPQTVNYGANGSPVTAVPATDYHFVKWNDNSTANPRTDTHVTADISVIATFAINTFTLTYMAGAHGSISGTSPQTVNYNGSGTAVKAVPATGYHFVNWSDGVLTATRIDTNVTANISVTANFAINTAHTLTYMAGTHGSITGASPQTVNYGGSGTQVTAVPATGYHFVNWSDTSTANPRTDTNVTANISVTATFATSTYTLTYTAGAHGSISGTSPQTVNYGGSGTAVTALPATGYHFVNWNDGVLTATRTDANVKTNITVIAIFITNFYTVIFQTDGTAGATLTGTTTQMVNHGADCTAVRANAPTNYHFVKWTKGGVNYSTDNPLTVTNVTENMTLKAIFASTKPSAAKNWHLYE